MIEHRYSDDNGMFTLRSWSDMKETTLRGKLEGMPHWLAEICNIAVIGGHMIRVQVPPPDNILWFMTDDDHTLLHFVEFSNQSEAISGYQLEMRPFTYDATERK